MRPSVVLPTTRPFAGLALILRAARRSFRGPLFIRFAVVVAMAVCAGAVAAMLPAVLGQAVSAVAGTPAPASPGELARIARLLMPQAEWAVLLATLAASFFAAGAVVWSNRLGSTLSGDLTAALRIELVRALLAASARAVAETGGRIGAAPPPDHPPPAGEGKQQAASEAARRAIVQLAVSREAALVGDFAVSVITSLPQSATTLMLLAIELVSGGAWFVLFGGAALFATSRLIADRSSRRVADRRLLMQNADAALFGSLQETLAATEDLRLWGARGQAVAELARACHDCAAARGKMAAAMAVAGQIKAVFTAMSPLLVVAALSLGGRAFGPGEVAKLLLLVPLLMARLEALDGLRQGLIERSPVIAATVALLSLPSAPPRAAGARRIEPGQVRGAITLKDVRFTPPGAAEPVIDGVSLAVPPGAMVGICGPSGSGKSTLLRLILRLDDPDRGRILLDDHDLCAIEPDQLPELFGVLRQSALLLERPLREVLAIGLRQAPDDAAMRAVLAQLGLHDLAEKGGARGLHTGVRRNPPNFSGGEARRLLLARMLLGPSRVCLIDEPEAGLPSATAEQILASIAEGAQGRTHLVVTHAPHLLRSDFNVVLDRGRLVATGRHEELQAGCPIYRDLLAEALRDRR